MNTENLTPVTVVEEDPAAPGGTPERHQLRRRPARGLVGGVCAGVAEYLEVEPLVVRVCFVVVVAASGIGLAIYPLAWALIPAAPIAAARLTSRSWRAQFSRWREAFGIALLVIAAVFALRGAGLWLGDAVVLPLVLASSGLALILREAGVSDWVPADALRGAARAGKVAPHPARWRSWPGGVVGAVLIMSAAIVLLRDAGILVSSRRAIGGFVVILVALGLVFGPWLAQLARSLANERSERIRSQERAELASHLHDSVLQTLALIQRRADDPRGVSALARRQERELRHWLFERSDRVSAATLAKGLEQAAADVEAIHGVPVEVVTVGDCPLDDRLTATVAAAREALTNAAKFAGGERIDLYAEIDYERVQVYVRDRGVGFDPTAVPADRRGLRDSVLERMRRHGGRAEINAAPGRGTEIELIMERT